MQVKDRMQALAVRKNRSALADEKSGMEKDSGLLRIIDING